MGLVRQRWGKQTSYQLLPLVPLSDIDRILTVDMYAAI